MVSQRASRVRAAALRRSAFSLAKSCSMGFRSGELARMLRWVGRLCLGAWANAAGLRLRHMNLHQDGSRRHWRDPAMALTPAGFLRLGRALEATRVVGHQCSARGDSPVQNEARWSRGC